MEVDAREQPDPRIGQLKDAGPAPEVEARIVERALDRMDGAPSRPWAWLVPTTALAGGVAVWAVLAPSSTPPSARLGHYTTTAAPQALALGPHQLELAAGTEADLVSAEPGAVQVELQKGRVECDVDPLAEGESFLVSTEHARVLVVGTRFSVSIADDCTRVAVAQGRVRVEAEGVEPAIVSAGTTREVCAPVVPVEAPPALRPEADIMREGLDRMAAGEIDAAIESFGAYRAAYPEGAFLEDALFHEAVLELRRDRPEAARALINHLAERFPESSQRKTLEDMLQR